MARLAFPAQTRLTVAWAPSGRSPNPAKCETGSLASPVVRQPNGPTAAVRLSWVSRSSLSYVAIMGAPGLMGAGERDAATVAARGGRAVAVLDGRRFGLGD